MRLGNLSIGTVMCLVIGMAVGPTTMGGETPKDAKAWFLEWARSLTFKSLHVEFETELGLPPKKDGTPSDPVISRGAWDLRLAPQYAQYLACKSYVKGEYQGEAEYAWDLARGEGKTSSRAASSVRTQGLKTTTHVKEFGMAHLPSASRFFHVRGRSVEAFLKGAQVSVGPCGPNGSLIAAYVEQGESKDLIVYILDPRKPQPLVEERLYAKPEPTPEDIKSLNKDNGFDIPLPEAYREGLLFANREILESAEVGGRWIPTKWRVRHCVSPPDRRIIVSLRADSIRFDSGDPEHGFDIKWPVGTTVWDEFEGMGFTVAGKESDKLQAEVIYESELDTILQAAGVKRPTDPTTRSTSPTITGCGSNALYVALSMLGKPKPLADLAGELGISEGQPLSSMAKLREASVKQGQDVLAVSGDREILETPPGAPVIVHVERNRRQTHPAGGKEQAHYFVIEGFDGTAGTVRVIDPPNMPYLTKVDDLLKIWTGNALLFDAKSIGDFRKRDSTRLLLRLSCIGVFGVTAALGAFLWLRRRTQNSPVA